METARYISAKMVLDGLLERIRGFSLEISGYSGPSWADMEEESESKITAMPTKSEGKLPELASDGDISSSLAPSDKPEEDLQTTSDQTSHAKSMTAGEDDNNNYCEAKEELERREAGILDRVTLIEKYISRGTPLSHLVMMKSAVQNAKLDYIFTASRDYSQRSWLFDAVEQERWISLHIFAIAHGDPFTFPKSYT